MTFHDTGWFIVMLHEATIIPRITTRLSTPMAQDNQSFHLKLLI